MTTDATLAVPELATIEIHGVTRGSFILKSALAAGAVYGAAAIGPFVGAALSQAGGDIDILNFALTLEYLEADFYEKAQALGLNAEAMKLAKEFGENEAAHVEALAATITKLGGTPAAKPTFTFPLKAPADFGKLAQTLEDTGVSAYNGAAPAIQSADVLGAAGAIVQVEARHAALIRLQRGLSPSPRSFDGTLDMEAVLAAVKPLIKA